MSNIQLSVLSQNPKSKEEIDIQVGASIAIVDGIRNFLSIPGKLLLWNSQINSGNVSEETISQMRDYLHSEGLHDVAVHVNQYRPDEVWRRIFTNPNTSALSKCTLGLVNGMMEQFVIPKLTGFPGDHYNPFSNTVHLFSNDPAIALHECGHAKDYRDKQYPSVYAMLRAAPGIEPVVTLYQEFQASNNAIQYLKQQSDVHALKHAWKLLTPAFATYVAYYTAPLFASPIAKANKFISQFQVCLNRGQYETLCLDNGCQEAVCMDQDCLETVCLDNNCETTLGESLGNFAGAVVTYSIATIAIIGIGHVIGRWMAARSSAEKEVLPVAKPHSPQTV